MTFDFDRVEVREVSRHYGRRRALNRVSFDCRAGDVMGLLGPNGAGKSTLISILATLVAPSCGSVLYGTATAAEAGPQLRARLGLLAHDLHLYPEMTARENLRFFARLYGLGDVERRVEAGLENAALQERADDTVSAFSRGMRQRLALERALLHAPRLLLLDEPFTGLADQSAVALVKSLKGLSARGAIVVLATHVLGVAEAVLDRVAVLREGRLVAVDDAREGLRKRYRTQVSEKAGRD
ncbi:MAG: ABC transporter ATP-binding protein [Acidobacteria bacterium]|nr:MAG: ABC transporter ATP-binding protein [Acidobacteriota bacterium]